MSLFTYEAGVATQLVYRWTQTSQLRLRLEARPTLGGDDLDHLTGARVYGSALQTRRFGWGRLGAKLGVRNYFDGVQTVTAFDETVCVGGCEVAAPPKFRRAVCGARSYLAAAPAVQCPRDPEIRRPALPR